MTNPQYTTITKLFQRRGRIEHWMRQLDRALEQLEDDGLAESVQYRDLNDAYDDRTTVSSPSMTRSPRPRSPTPATASSSPLKRSGACRRRTAA